MNTRRPTDAAGHSWRKFVDEQPRQPDPDPLHVGDPLELAAAEQAAFDEGYERGVLDSLPPFFVVLLVGITAAILGGMVGWSVGMGLR